MNDYIWLDFLEYGEHGLERGDVAIIVGDAVGIGTAVSRGVEIEDGNFGDGALEEEVDNVMTKEAAAANYEDIAELVLFS